MNSKTFIHICIFSVGCVVLAMICVRMSMTTLYNLCEPASQTIDAAFLSEYRFKQVCRFQFGKTFGCDSGHALVLPLGNRGGCACRHSSYLHMFSSSSNSFLLDYTILCATSMLLQYRNESSTHVWVGNTD